MYELFKSVVFATVFFPVTEVLWDGPLVVRAVTSMLLAFLIVYTWNVAYDELPT